MARKSKKNDGPKESEFKKFIKKRAPIYLAVAAIVVIFIVPEITKSNLQSHFPEDLTAEESRILDALMGYSGSDGEGLSMVEALTDRINEEYPGEKIYDHRRTTVNLSIQDKESDTYLVLLDFESHKGVMNYSWDISSDGKNIRGNNSISEYVVGVVDFYD
ncbi:MAG: hypothetical protein OXC46_04990 [Thaumarchaeota archaeon]|nr:hypothetical protein [Nitrososphaerota archaeon]